MYTLQPAKKSRGCINVLAAIGVIALAFIGLVIVAVFSVSSAVSTSSYSSATHHGVYKATTSRLKWGDCFGFDATYEMPNGTAQKSGGACGGSKSVVVDERAAFYGDFVYLSIQNDEWSARIGCEVWVDGKLVYQTFSEGQYVIASCSGSVK